MKVLPTLVVAALAIPAMIASTPVVVAASEDGEPTQTGCNNYGFSNQVTVTGDNEQFNNCSFEHCAGGPSGAAGVGTTVNANTEEAGAQASAGTNCYQNDTAEMGPLLEEIR